MNWLAGTIIAAITAFAATNIDDIIILLLFFAQTNSSFRIRHIIAGQYLGFIALIVASSIGFFGGLLVPKAWIGILGLVPIVIGISHLVRRNHNEQEIQAVSSEQIYASGKKLGICNGLLSPQTFHVAAVTFANGGDNIGIYVPLFANSNSLGLAVILGVFFVLIGVWCYVAYRLMRQPAIANIITDHGKSFVPFLLIGLGIFILIESGTYQLMWGV